MTIAYSIRILPSARKELEALHGSDQKRVVSAIRALSSEPRPRGCRQLVGTDADYRVRAGDLRVVYEVNDSLELVTIYRIRHRKDVYK